MNFHKLRFMACSQRQRLGGIVVNARPNVRRRDVDLLEATLFNCARRGPSRENRSGHPRFREHLLGRVSWVQSVNPARGAELAALFARIDWTR